MASHSRDIRDHVRRLLRVIHSIRANDYPNCGGLADELGCDERTIRRYVTLLRELGAEIEYDAGMRGYYMRNKRWRLDQD